MARVALTHRLGQLGLQLLQLGRPGPTRRAPRQPATAGLLGAVEEVTRAPARLAANTESSSSNIVRTTTVGAGYPWLSRRVAWTTGPGLFGWQTGAVGSLALLARLGPSELE
jgi:hypothetical protein